MTKREKEVHEMVRAAGWGGGILSHIRQEDVMALAALHAPYGLNARDAYFAEMRALADKQAPCTYQRYSKGQPVPLPIKVSPK